MSFPRWDIIPIKHEKTTKRKRFCEVGDVFGIDHDIFITFWQTEAGAREETTKCQTTSLSAETTRLLVLEVADQNGDCVYRLMREDGQIVWLSIGPYLRSFLSTIMLEST